MKRLFVISVVLSLYCFNSHADHAAPIASAAKPEAAITCTTRIPAATKVNPQTLSAWAEKAAVQSFDFSYATMDAQFNDLKRCYTDEGWKGFYDALKKSGNIQAIRNQKLTVSSQVNGEIKINPIKENQWKVTLPLQVVYQNDKEKLTQLLVIDLLVGRKINGDLGILQIIAAPKASNTPGTTSATPQ